MCFLSCRFILFDRPSYALCRRFDVRHVLSSLHAGCLSCETSLPSVQVGNENEIYTEFTSRLMLTNNLSPMVFYSSDCQSSSSTLCSYPEASVFFTTPNKANDERVSTFLITLRCLMKRHLFCVSKSII